MYTKRDMEYYTTNAFVLKKEIAGERDNLYHFFTKDYGRLDLLAKGTRDVLAKLTGHLELPALVEISFTLEHRPQLINALEKEPYFKIKHQEQGLKSAFKILNLVDEFTLLNQKDDELYQLLSDVLFFLEKNLERSSEVAFFSEAYFNAQLLRLLGYQPFLEGCLECGKADTHYFSFAKRGLVCNKHFKKGDLPLTLEQKKSLKLLFNFPLNKLITPQLFKQIIQEKRFLETFLEQFTFLIKFDIFNKQE